jgi:hypothetical protein
MNKVDKDLATALARLNGNHDFKVFRKWLEESYTGHLDGIIDLQAGDATEKGKGYCGALKDIIEKFKDPHKLVEKFNKPTA